MNARCVESLAHYTSSPACIGACKGGKVGEIITLNRLQSFPSYLWSLRRYFPWRQHVAAHFMGVLPHFWIPTISRNRVVQSNGTLGPANFRNFSSRKQCDSAAPQYNATKTMPRLTLVGRENVGKSSLYNCLVTSGAPTSKCIAGNQLALVGPDPGTTRDRREYLWSCGSLTFLLTDTPSILADVCGATDTPKRQINHQVKQQPKWHWLPSFSPAQAGYF